MTSRRSVSRLTAALVVPVAIAACADDGPQSGPTVVGVTVQRCEQPNGFHGVGVVVGDDIVATAGHLVEGDLRRLAVVVDGATVPASLVALDRRTDLALLTVDLGADSVAAEPAAAIPASATVVTPADDLLVTIDRLVTQVVHHATDHATYRRDTVVFAPAVAPGTSGAPLLDASNRLVGIVLATLDAETYAVTTDEVSDLVTRAQVEDVVPAARPVCPSPPTPDAADP